MSGTVPLRASAAVMRGFRSTWHVFAAAVARVAPAGSRTRSALRGLVFGLLASAGGMIVVAARIATCSSALEDSEARFDAAIVLGAAVHGNKPSPVLQGRLEYAVELLRTGRVQMLIVTGGGRSGQRWSEAEVSARYLRQHGVPAERILLEARSRTTRENLCFASPIARAHGIRSLALVTDPLHMARALYIARALELNLSPAATPHTRFRSQRARTLFLARETYLYTGMLLAGRQRCA